ncbi:MAG TPA: hypothetical protein DCS43_13835, partial [Verrucomicrobia bacterium]|nr:hypothetical protein [Verrucomicrobiota bacterium]
SRDMTERVTMERELRHHAEIEMLMANISMQFINIKPEDAEEAIQDALGKVGRTIGVDRVYVFEYAPDLSSSSNTYEWCADGIEPQIDNLQEVPSDILPWWQRHMLALKNVVIEEVMALPDEAVNERELLASQGILSLLVVPLSWGGQLGGFLGFDSVRRKKTWSNDDIAPLELLAGIVHNAVKHRAAQVELHELNESLERRVAERTREVESIQSQLYMTEKLASVGQLAAGVAHEINNPVSFVSTNFASLEENIRYLVDVLQAGDRLVAAVEHQSPDVMACAEEIKTLRQRYAIDFVLKDLPALFAESRDGIGRITSIVNSMRNFARQDVIDHVAPFDLNAGIRDTLVITRNSYKYHAAIDLDLGEIPMIQGVAGQINQVLLNLIVNAAQALAGHPVPDGGNGIIRISTGVIGDNVFCRVEDNGPGVPETNLSRIFDPFFTTKSPGDGTGLGLSISYDIVVNKHKGGLICRPSSLGGACFMMFLPTQREEPAE